MKNLTTEGQALIQSISGRYGLSPDSAYSMLVAVNNGSGSMAQFYCPELGSGQWMRGGMIMVGDMFNNGLKNTVNNLCDELSSALATQQIFQPAPAGSNSSNNWWPGDLGSPSSAGAQNNIRYAFFPHARRLAVQRDGHVSLFDTREHIISGVSQQQGPGSSLTFASQYGTISTLDLPLVSGPGFHPTAETNFAAPPMLAPSSSPKTPQPAPSDSSGHGQAELLGLLEKLGQLRDGGVLTHDEFNAKKADLLRRL